MRNDRVRKRERKRKRKRQRERDRDRDRDSKKTEKERKRKASKKIRNDAEVEHSSFLFLIEYGYQECEKNYRPSCPNIFVQTKSF